jgi:hypothetical protein
MVCSTKTAGAAAKRGSVNRSVNRRRTLHSIPAHYTYENDCFCGDDGGRGKTLVFCSDKDAKERYEFNIFTAKWEK